MLQYIYNYIRRCNMKETREVVFEENNHKEAMGDCKMVVVINENCEGK